MADNLKQQRLVWDLRRKILKHTRAGTPIADNDCVWREAKTEKNTPIFVRLVIFLVDYNGLVSSVMRNFPDELQKISCCARLTKGLRQWSVRSDFVVINNALRYPRGNNTCSLLSPYWWFNMPVFMFLLLAKLLITATCAHITHLATAANPVLISGVVEVSGQAFPPTVFQLRPSLLIQTVCKLTRIPSC